MAERDMQHRPEALARDVPHSASRGVTVLVVALVVVGLLVGIMSLGGLLAYLPYAVVGGLLAIRRPRAATGWLLIGIGWAVVLASIPSVEDPNAIESGTSWPLATFITWLSATVGFAALALFVVVMVIFPASRLPGGRWRGPALALIAVAWLGAILNAFGPTIAADTRDGTGSVVIANPFAVAKVPALSWLEPFTDLGALPGVAALVVGAAAMVVRMHRARGVERQQLRWLVAALVAVAVSSGIAVTLTLILGDLVPGIVYIPVVAAIVLVPVPIAFAVLRYRLYDIDTLINRTVLYAAITILILGIFGTANVGLQQAAQAWIGGPSVLLAGFLGIGVGLLYVPIRRAVRPVVDRFLPGRSMLTLLFTDIVGSTEQLVTLGDERWRLLLGRYRAAVRQELARFSGTEVDTAGDAFFATFERPSTALRCAVAVRAASEKLGIQLRTGLHVGEVEMRGEKVSGMAVHAAARIMAAADAGEILFSAAIGDAIPTPEFTTIERGSRELKGLPGTWQLFAIGAT